MMSIIVFDADIATTTNNLHILIIKTAGFVSDYLILPIIVHPEW